jgi:hypothetical protein
MLTRNLAEQFATRALAHVTREYPNKLDQVLTGPGDLAAPRVLHPVFFGSFDWHSCVHAHWLLARLLRRFPTLAASGHIRDHFAAAFTTENVSVELARLSRPLSGTFERPYGWAWLLMLAAESRHHQNGNAYWAIALKPLADAFARRFLDFLPKASYPVRSGVHSNTAFALALAMDYARACSHEELAHAVTETARRWYHEDANCQAWEPGGEDFLSPALIEAECMRRILPAEEFGVWFTRFLPSLERLEPAALFQPVVVSDRRDGRIAHLDGLNLSRAWCWSRLATSVAANDPRAGVMHDAATRHLEASIGHIADDYMGGHWLASFALLALEAAEDG